MTEKNKGDNDCVSLSSPPSLVSRYIHHISVMSSGRQVYCQIGGGRKISQLCDRFFSLPHSINTANEMPDPAPPLSPAAKGKRGWGEEEGEEEGERGRSIGNEGGRRLG